MDGYHSREVVVTALFCLMLSGAHSQSVFVRFNGTTVKNNSWIDFERIGATQRLECFTDANACCSSSEGLAGRAWFLPNETKLSQDGVREIRAFDVIAGAQKIDLRLTDATARSDPALSGVYECSIDNATGQRENVYVGIYYKSGTGG